jgi:hypothetical protein
MNSKPLLLLTTLLTGSAAGLSGSANAQETVTLQTIHSSGTNTSPGAAQLLDLSDGTNVPLFDAALTAFNARNSDTVLQNATSFTAAGQFVSPQFFPFGSSAVGVNSNLNVVGHLTAPGTAGATNYFGFAETAGGQIGLFGKATQPPNQGTELLLSDENGNLVAIASGNGPDGLSSRIDFTVPDGDTGTWQTAITQGPSTTAPINYLLQLQMPYTALSQFTTNVIGSGQEKNGSLGIYDVNANIGDNLAFDVNATTPLTATELLLFDPNGNLVAIAAGNGSDGLSSIIDFTVPDGDQGEWQIEVAPSEILPVPQAYAYDLAIQGASGLGPVNPSPVPEPSTWALALAGFVSLGLMSWRRAGREMAPASVAPRG